MDYSGDDWRRLGRAVHAARLRLGKADTNDWALTVGRSTRVVLGLERGEPVGRSTLTRVENALGWAPGRAWGILGEATVTESNPQPAAEGTRVAVGHTRQSPEPYLSRRDPDYDSMPIDELQHHVNAALEALAKRARSSNPDADR